MPENEIEVEYNPAFSDVFLSEHRYCILKGGAGSGKSVVCAQKIVGRIISEPGHRILVLRKVSTTIKRSVWDLILDVFEQVGHRAYLNINKTDRTIEYVPNGNLILFAGIDDPEKLKSIIKITSAWLEEITEFDEDDLDQVDLRLRGETPYYKQILGSFNPVDIDHWLKPKFFDTQDPDVFTHESNYLDNCFLDDDYIRVLETRFKSNENYYNIYVLNRWGKPQTGYELYRNFKLSRHVVEKRAIDPEAPIHISFDFNVVPYITATLWQIEKTLDDQGAVKYRAAYQVREYCLKDPFNNTPSIATKIATDLEDHKGGLWVYGDPSGKQRATRDKEAQNDFDIILDKLRHLGAIDRVQSSAPSVRTRADWINKELYEDDQLKIRIVKGCEETIRDYEQVKQDSDGSKLKKKTKDKSTGISYEPLGHTSDANDYFLVACFGDLYSEFKRGGVQDLSKRTFAPRTQGRGSKKF